MSDLKTTPLLPPSARPRHGESPPLQAHFFTSSHFVEPLRKDINELLKAYVTRCKVALTTKEDPKPFKWFREIWTDQKWHLFHLRCIQPKPRKTFLEVTFRLFLEKIPEKEPVLHRLTALFAVYTLFMNQPRTNAADLYSLPYIPITIDLYEELVTLPGTLPPTFDHYATYIIQQLVSRSAFVFLPSSALDSHAPTVLPDSSVSIVPESGSTLATNVGGKAKVKTGRPSALDLQRRAIRAISSLDAWASKASLSTPNPPSSGQPSNVDSVAMTESNYAQAKKFLAETVPGEQIKSAEQATLSKMKQLEDIWTRQGWQMEPGLNENGREGVAQLERAIQTPEGLLGLSKSVNMQPRDQSS